MITLGGDAELELVDSLDPFSEGIVFSVRPPKKSWKNISNLSGGEKTLSSLALVFALHHYKPTPLYVMDEIDAALVSQTVDNIYHLITSLYDAGTNTASISFQYLQCPSIVLLTHILQSHQMSSNLHTFLFPFPSPRILKMCPLSRTTSRNVRRMRSSSLSVLGQC